MDTFMHMNKIGLLKKWMIHLHTDYTYRSYFANTYMNI